MKMANTERILPTPTELRNLGKKEAENRELVTAIEKLLANKLHNDCVKGKSRSELKISFKESSRGCMETVKANLIMLGFKTGLNSVESDGIHTLSVSWEQI